ncbi:hypothetical protein GCM10020218_076150 [Dactylosporangium vinaceum]
MADRVVAGVEGRLDEEGQDEQRARDQTRAQQAVRALRWAGRRRGGHQRIDPRHVSTIVDKRRAVNLG